MVLLALIALCVLLGVGTVFSFIVKVGVLTIGFGLAFIVLLVALLAGIGRTT